MAVAAVGAVGSDSGDPAPLAQLTLLLFIWLLGALVLWVSCFRLRENEHSRLNTAGDTPYQSFYENAPIACHSLNEQGRILSVSTEWLKLLGYGSDEVLGRGIGDFVDPASAICTQDMLSQAQTAEALPRQKLSFRHKDGSQVRVMLDARGAMQSTGKNRYLHCVLHKLGDCSQEEHALSQIKAGYQRLFDDSPNLMFVFEMPTLRMLAVNDAALRHYGYLRDEFMQLTVQNLHPLDEEPLLLRTLFNRPSGISSSGPWRHVKKNGSEILVEIQSLELIWEGRQARCSSVVDITERKRAEEVLKKRMIALTMPPGVAGNIDFDDLFNREDIQKLQDQFAHVTGVASIITRLDGTPITKPSCFTLLCAGIIRQTELGRCSCYKSDALLGRLRSEKPIVQLCLSGGLWDAGVSIIVGGQHIANWLIGQVRNDAQNDAQMKLYARTIGVDEEEFMKAYRQVPVMSREHFEAVAETVTTLVQHLSIAAYQNIQQARFIAEIDRTKQALRVSEEQFRATIEHSGAGYFRVDRRGCYEAVNSAWLHMHSFTAPEQILGRHFSVTLAQKDRLAAEIVFRKGLEGLKMPTGEFTRILTDGSVGYHTFSLNPVQRSGEIVAIEGFLIDSTLLHRAKTDYQMLFDTMFDGFALFEIEHDTNGKPVDYRYLSVNPAFEQHTGLKGSDVLGRTFLEVFPETEASWLEVFERVALSGKAELFENYSRELKRYFFVRAYSPSPKRFVCMMADITERKRLEAQFLRAQRLESLGALASGVAHDLNNVLTPILMSVELLRPLVHAPEDRETLQLLSDSARRGSDIVQQLLMFGRGSDSPRAPLKVNTIIKEMGRMIRGTFPKNIVLSVQAPADLWLVTGDKTQLHQVLLNLCVNARDAMPQGGKLTIVAENVQIDDEFATGHGGKRTGSHVRIEVRDTGTGISQENLVKIFDPFFTTKPVGQGTGLGLATVLGIVRSHEGLVEVKTAIGQGTTFEIYLPAAFSASPPGAGEFDRTEMMGRNELVLVVEDEENIRSMLQRTLASHNYRVLIASNGQEALDVFGRNGSQVSLVITDVMMPVMDGTQTILSLRRLNPDLPVMLMSGLPSREEELGKQFGPNLRFMSKPFDADYALQLVREILDASA